MSLRGELSRWLIEPKTGVFVGHLSARVRDELWLIALKKCNDGSVLQIWSTNSPQGYQCRSNDRSERKMIDMEGITLVKRPPKPTRKRKLDGTSGASPEAERAEQLFDNPTE